MTTIYKLTNQDLTTHGGYRWVLGQWRKRDGTGPLCGPGWLHSYPDPLLAVLFNPIHADIPSPRLWRGEGRGKHLDDHGIKSGYTQMRIMEELPLPDIRIHHRVAFGLLCTLEINTEPAFAVWAKNWLSGQDRSAAVAASAVAASAYAVHARRSSSAAHAYAAATHAAATAYDTAAAYYARATYDAAVAAAAAIAYAYGNGNGIDLIDLMGRAMEVAP